MDWSDRIVTVRILFGPGPPGVGAATGGGADDSGAASAMLGGFGAVPVVIGAVGTRGSAPLPALFEGVPAE